MRALGYIADLLDSISKNPLEPSLVNQPAVENKLLALHYLDDCLGMPDRHPHQIQSKSFAHLHHWCFCITPP